ncbi:hypothetical protein [Paracoccus mutanolyticus]|uniref:hypothetical protein n=1 Tax=Paracoccus mutanolyticus TaxID=1499308 RepID=UPI0011AE359B|nr:hypothetical protein [Paracoccus mutanolyticus]
MTQAQGFLAIGIGFEILAMMEDGSGALIWGILAIVRSLPQWCGAEMPTSADDATRGALEIMGLTALQEAVTSPTRHCLAGSASGPSAIEDGGRAKPVVK